MRKEAKWTLVSITAAMTLLGCSGEKRDPKHAAPTASSSAPASAPLAAPAPNTSARPPLHQCPTGSSGEGTLSKPCMATGASRMMQVTWTGKVGENGPSFRVVNKSPSVILYGTIFVYFYDKAGDQLQAVLSSDTSTSQEHSVASAPGWDRIGSKKTTLTTTLLTSCLVCSGNIFGRALKPGEETVIMAPCVQRKNVPEGTKAIEGEISTVGFADPSERNVDYYWRNGELVPDKRRKGGTK